MCEKQVKIDKLEHEREELLLEMSQIRKNYSEVLYNEKRAFWHPMAVVLIPLTLSMLTSVAAVIIAVTK